MSDNVNGTLLDDALSNIHRRKHKLNIAFARLDKAPLHDWKDLQDSSQSDDSIRTCYSQVQSDVKSWGFICGRNGLLGIDFDWGWVYRLWTKCFAERAETLTVRTPNGGFRPFFRVENPRTDDTFKNTLHCEFKGIGRFAVLEGEALREDGTKGEYQLTKDFEIRRDDQILDDTLHWLKELFNQFDFLNYSCIKAQLRRKVLNPDHNLRLILSSFMAYRGLSVEHALNFFEDCPNFDDSRTHYQLEYTKSRTKQGLKPPRCEKLQEMLTWDEQSCIGCARRDTKTPDTNGSGRESQADVLVQLALGKGIELFLDTVGDAYARVKDSERVLTYRVQSHDFKIWLAQLLWNDRKKAPRSEALASATNVLEAKARFEGGRYRLYSRVAPDPEGHGFWYDLTDDSWRAVHVTAGDWQVMNSVPILFRRYSHQQPQVEPQKTGNIFRLLDFLNIANDDDKLLILVYAVACFVPCIPHPLLILFGPQGSAKTTAMVLLRRLVDPSSICVLSLPREDRELVQQFYHNWMLIYDNVSILPTWTSDALCRASTGGGFSKRRLYTDESDVIFDISCCVGLNGINVSATRPDLLDRGLLIGFQAISNDERKPEKKILFEFEAARSKILGGIFDTLSKAMSLFPRIQLTELPRMADFAVWGCAIAEALGYPKERFLSAYGANIRRQVEEAAESSPVAEAVLAFIEDCSNQLWSGSFSELLSELEKKAEKLKICIKSHDWPKGAHVLSRHLNELKAPLAALGVSIERCRGSEGQKIVTIRKDTRKSANSDKASDSQRKPLENAGDKTDATSSSNDKSNVKKDSSCPGASVASDATSPTVTVCGKREGFTSIAELGPQEKREAILKAIRAEEEIEGYATPPKLTYRLHLSKEQLQPILDSLEKDGLTVQVKKDCYRRTG
jgi:hypothetical protein